MEKVLMSPIVLSPGDRLVTVFGGGKVALRKCRHFEGFRIRVVSPEVLPELEGIAEEVVHVAVDPETAGTYMDGSDIVVAATASHELNDAIRDVSMSRGIMTNSAHGGGDVLIPSTLHRDGFTVTVSSEGRVPAFPPYVIERIDELLDPSYDSMLELLVSSGRSYATGSPRSRRGPRTWRPCSRTTASGGCSGKGTGRAPTRGRWTRAVYHDR